MDRLITIGASHFCEKARWALQRAGMPFREICHPPVFHVFVAKRLTGGRTVPVLVTPDRALADSTDILKHVDRSASLELRLYPDDPGTRSEVEALEDLFDRSLGPAARRLVYFHLLREPAFYPVLAEGVAPVERALFRALFPLCRTVIARALRVDADGAARSRAKLDDVMVQVDRMLQDGRRYLAGDRFGAADLTFAALAAPLLYPPEYGFELPPLASLPAAFREQVARFRETDPGRFCLRLYAGERDAARPPAPTS